MISTGAPLSFPSRGVKGKIRKERKIGRAMLRPQGANRKSPTPAAKRTPAKTSSKKAQIILPEVGLLRRKKRLIRSNPLPRINRMPVLRMDE